MGNAAMCGAGRGVATRDAVIVLRADGTVLTFYHRIRVADLVAGFPNHFVCHSNALLLMQQGKILPLHCILRPGDIYFLLPLPDVQTVRRSSSDDTETSSLLQVDAPPSRSRTSGTTKFVISQKHFSRILSEGSARDSMKKQKHQSRPVVKKAMTWQPGLASIEEVST